MYTCHRLNQQSSAVIACLLECLRQQSKPLDWVKTGWQALQCSSSSRQQAAPSLPPLHRSLSEAQLSGSSCLHQGGHRTGCGDSLRRQPAQAARQKLPFAGLLDLINSRGDTCVSDASLTDFASQVLYDETLQVQHTEEPLHSQFAGVLSFVDQVQVRLESTASPRCSPACSDSRQCPGSG